MKQDMSGEVKINPYLLDTTPAEYSMSVPAGMNLHFCNSHREALQPDLGDRRYTMVATDAAIHAGEVVDPNWPYSERQTRADLIALASKLKPSQGSPVAWIIERDGRVAMIHYEACAVKAEADGYIVTPYYSRVK